jgi:SAM-dependent methyltransferase
VVLLIPKRYIDKYYPPDRFDGTFQFYTRIRSRISKGMKVLNMGCGLPSRNPIKILKGEVSWIVGADVDPAAALNDEVDEVFIYDGNAFPFREKEFDIVYCDYVMEHLERPVQFMREIRRVLKPGGIFFFRTPNRFHYVPIATRLIPRRWHERLSKRLRNLSNEDDKTYPTFYAFNSRSQIVKAALSAGFHQDSITLEWVECEPYYLLFSLPTFIAGLLYERIVNSSSLLKFFRVNIFGAIENN